MDMEAIELSPAARRQPVSCQLSVFSFQFSVFSFQRKLIDMLSEANVLGAVKVQRSFAPLRMTKQNKMRRQFLV
jgi:hypothetical protein